MNTIYKYSLIGPTKLELSLPLNARILTAHQQGGYPQLWALVDTDSPYVIRTIEIFATGEQLYDTDTLQYITTLFMDTGLIYHVFERTL